MIDVYYYFKMTNGMSYTAKFKLSVINIATEIGNRAAARKFDLNKCTLCDFQMCKTIPKGTPAGIVVRKDKKDGWIQN